MIIHTVKPGESIFNIARKYSTAPQKIIENNELKNPDALPVGKMLLIVTPTRTYTVRGRDDLDSIAERFSTTKETLRAYNPYLCGKDGIYPGQILSIKHDAKRYGVAMANGYVYKSTPEERISLAMPYVTHLTLSSAKRCGSDITRLFDDRAAKEMAKREGKIVLLRVYDEGADFPEEYGERLISEAVNGGYDGITLAAYNATKNDTAALEEFLIRLKRSAMENNLLIFTEIDGNEKARLRDATDGTILFYEKAHLENAPGFDDGEGRFMTNYAEENEAYKAYIDISSSAYMGDEEITKEEAERIAYAARKEIQNDEKALLSSFSYTRYVGANKEEVRVAYESMENIKAKLELVSLLGFMGISFDIGRIPVEYLMMFEVMFNHPKTDL